ncbi:hypothetical protein D3C75_622080 [compost metagenome]
MEAAFAGIQRHRHIRVECAVAVSCGEQVQTAPALGIIQQRVAGLNRGCCQYPAALLCAQIRQAGLQQYFCALGNHCRLSGRTDLLEAVRQSLVELRFILGIITEPVLCCSGFLQQNLMGLIVSLLLKLGILRIGKRCCCQRRRHHPPAHHIERRVHSGHNPVVAHFRSACQQLLEPLRNSIGQRQGSEIRGISMAARESAVRSRRTAHRRNQRRHNYRGIQPAERAHVIIERF